jgi:hypothetical protein
MSIYTTILKKLTQGKNAALAFKSRAKASLEWYRKKINSVYPNKLLIDQKADSKTNKTVTGIHPGSIYSFVYMPKYAKTLPYYDIFPLVLVLSEVPGGFLGLNMHYLRPIDRALFMDKLYEFIVKDSATNGLKINVTYPTLTEYSSLRYYKACIKRYRYSNIGNFFVFVDPSEWDMALFLPTENFQKETTKNVWEDSRSKY